MRPTLSASLIVPLLAHIHAQSSLPACSPNARKPTWNLHDVIYTEQSLRSPDITTATSNMTFSLSSNTRPFIANCTASHSWSPPNYDGGTWYPCEMPDAALPSDQAWFTFDDGGRIGVNQTYTCVEDVGPTVTRYGAFGEEDVTLDCAIEGWRDGDRGWEWESNVCSLGDTAFDASEVWAVA